MSDISKLPARQVDQSHDTLAGLAREVLRRYENAKDWRQSPDDWKDANRTRIYMRKACEVAPTLARAVLEMAEEVAHLTALWRAWESVGEEQQSENKRLREALEAVEWVDDHCSYCGYLRPYHDPYCSVALALAQAGSNPANRQPADAGKAGRLDREQP